MAIIPLNVEISNLSLVEKDSITIKAKHRQISFPEFPPSSDGIDLYWNKLKSKLRYALKDTEISIEKNSFA
jgi:hypothetical protein